MQPNSFRCFGYSFPMVYKKNKNSYIKNFVFFKLENIVSYFLFQAYVEKHSLKEPSAKKKGLILLSDKMTCKKIHSDYKAYSLLDPGKETIILFSFGPK